MALGAKCEECPLYGCREGPVLGEWSGKANLDLVVIGKGPGRDEVERGRPHIGKSGQIIRKPLRGAFLTNAWLCRAPTGDQMDLFVRRLRVADKARQRKENAKAKREHRKPKKITPTPTPAQCCAPRLQTEIKNSQAGTILVLGREALRAVGSLYGIPVGKTKEERPDNLRLATLKAQMGHPFQVPQGPTLYVTMHPAAAMEGRGLPHMRHVIDEHLQNSKRLARHKGKWQEPEPKELILPPEVWDRKFYLRILDWFRRYELAGRPILTVDIETDGIDWYTKIRCIGFGADLDVGESILVVPLRYRDGSSFWPPNADKKVRQILRKLLNEGRG